MTIAVLSFSRMARDGRVLRQVEALAALGLSPRCIGYGDAGDSIAWPLETFPTPQVSTLRRIMTVVRQCPAHLGLWAARLGFWQAPQHRWALDRLRQIRPAQVIANDWPALVVAARWQAESGCPFHYDTHEFATAEFDHSLWWRLVYKPIVCHLEREAIGKAFSVSTVGPSLAAAIEQRYGLAAPVAVVRNVPHCTPVPPVTHGWPLRILYHGVLLPGRGLELLIDSVPLWSGAHRLILRGDGPPAYKRALEAQAATMIATGRISFVPAVLPGEVIPAAARDADVGVHVTPLTTLQSTFNLPNKVFEYIAAGLAVLVTPAPDQSAIVERHGVGLTTRVASAEAIAEAINALTPESVARFQANAGAAAAALCWENERLIFQAVVQRLVAAGPPAAASCP